MTETFLLTRRSRRLLDRLRGVEPTKAEHAALGTGLLAPAWAVEVPTCAGTYRLAGRAAFHVTVSQRLAEAVTWVAVGLRLDRPSPEKFSRAVAHLASLDRQANAALAAALEETAKACAKAKAGGCTCGARFAIVPTALADPSTANKSLGRPLGPDTPGAMAALAEIVAAQRAM